MLARIDRRLLCSAAILSTLIVGVLASSASTARAQAWLSDRDSAEGSGIRLGDLELHPGLGAEVGYDTNVFLEESDPSGSAMLRVTPHLLLSTIGEERRGEGEQRGGPPAVTFRGGLSASYYHFFEDSARDNVSGDLNLRLTINPERPFQVQLSESFVRTIRPFAPQTSSRQNYARDANVAGVKFIFGTAGGVFSSELGYALAVDFFESSEFNFANNVTHTISGGVNWKFLPQTAILYDANVDIQGYVNGEEGAGAVLLNDSVRLRTRLGLNGAFTKRFSASALLGYSAGFYDRQDEYESIVAQLEARWRPSENVRLSVGYDRNYFASFVGNFYRRDQLYSKLQVMLASSFLLGLDANVGYLDFGAPLNTMGMAIGTAGERSDIRVGLKLFGEYRVRDWLGFNASLEYQGDFTDFEFLRTTGPMMTVPEAAGYSKFEAWLGVRAFL